MCCGDQKSFKKINLSLNWSWGQVNWIFDNPTVFLPVKNRKFFNQGSKKMEFFFRKSFCFFLAMFQQEHKEELWQPAEIVLPEKKVLLFNVRACFENWTIFKKNFFASDWTFGHVEASFDRSNEFFMAEGQKFLLNIRKWWKNLEFFFKKRWFFLETFRWKHTMQLLKSLKILFDKRLKKLARSPNMIKRPKFFLENLFPQNCPMAGKKQFSQLYQVFFG